MDLHGPARTRGETVGIRDVKFPNHSPRDTGTSQKGKPKKR